MKSTMEKIQVELKDLKNIVQQMPKSLSESSKSALVSPQLNKAYTCRKLSKFTFNLNPVTYNV